ncbi:FAD/NAD(P)-binding protein [Microbacterium betulae]|uniref:FAD/NAD(P)-binding protein n=1 Tax=Microbacterium betulae TaxID=2981139 RepID=A0AA97FGN4_9MICO|nr:FAD/NAD(P)-binding protein [Microbacterium sp. AB]WOF23196.1 FAD/NAD(P)-binding protein [Microbacterium sp. AB]
MTTPRVVFAGAGPRAAMLLERLLARLGERERLDVVLVDPHPAGGGRIWRHAQSPLLKLNSMARDVTVFTDDSCRIDGPVEPGPSLIRWAELWRDGALPDVELDASVVDEARALRGDGFPTRRLHSHYLDWFLRRTIASAPEGVDVSVRRGLVTTVQDDADGTHVVALDDGTQIAADVVVYALGHNGRRPDDASQALVDASSDAGLVYVPPSFTADADLDVLEAGADVVVRGMGLAAVDLVVLLTEGRGGRFIREEDGALRYAASGREPHLHIGSRRGVPYRSKVSSAIRGEAPVREVLTPEAIADLLARPAALDFARDAWPLIASELLHGHYRELFTGYPERVRGTWPEFRETLRSHAWDDPDLLAGIADVVPDPRDRFDVQSLDTPLAGEDFPSAEALHHRVYAHIREDLALRTSPDHSAAQGVFVAALLSFVALAEVPADRWNARSRAVSLQTRWQTFFSYVASGPPAHRLEELLALADAGIVRFLGHDAAVRVEPGRGFVASSPHAPGEIVAPALVDAWLPAPSAAESDNPALRELAEETGTELHVADETFSGSLGRIVTDVEGRIVRPDGTAHATLFGIGPFTSGTDGGAFTRPDADSLSLRVTDRIAGALAVALGVGAPVAVG